MIQELALRYETLYQTLLEEHQKVFKAQPVEDIARLISAIDSANRVFVVGAGREGIAARSFTMRVMHLGKAAYWLWDDATPGMDKGDLFIAVNGSGKIGHIDYIIDQARGTGAQIAVITGSPMERTPKAADICFFVPACVYKGNDKRVVASIQPMGNLFEQHLFLLFDIIIMLAAEQLGRSAQEMERRHRNVE